MKYSLTLIVVLAVCVQKCFSSYLRPCTDNKNVTTNRTEYAEIGPPLIFHDLESVLKVLQKPHHKRISEVQALLDYYYAAKSKKDEFEASGGIKKYPLIELEGLSGSGKTTIAGILSTKLNGTQSHTPPRPIQNQHIRTNLRNNQILDTAYHYLSNYISALEVTQLLRDSPVIIDRYYFSTAAFSIAMAVNNYPEKFVFPMKGESIYSWPEDLLKPDIVLFLDVSEEIREERISKRNQMEAGITAENPVILNKAKTFKRPDGLGNFMSKCPIFRENLIQVYKNIQNPSATVINGNPPLQQVLEEIYLKLKPLFPHINLN